MKLSVGTRLIFHQGSFNIYWFQNYEKKYEYIPPIRAGKKYLLKVFISIKIFKEKKNITFQKNVYCAPFIFFISFMKFGRKLCKNNWIKSQFMYIVQLYLFLWINHDVFKLKINSFVLNDFFLIVRIFQFTHSNRSNKLRQVWFIWFFCHWREINLLPVDNNSFQHFFFFYLSLNCMKFVVVTKGLSFETMTRKC